MMKLLLALVPAAMLCACSTTNITVPGRSASEEMLISTAADRAAASLARNLAVGEESVFVDSAGFEQLDGKYAIGAIRTALARRGAHLAFDRTKADLVLEIRAGALSVDRHKFLIGIPEFSLPFPLAGTISVPEIAFYSLHEEQGVAKFAATALKGADGTLVDAPDPQYGYSHHKKRTVMLFISWTRQDYVADNDKDREAED